MLGGKVYTLDVMPTEAVLEVKAMIDEHGPGALVVADEGAFAVVLADGPLLQFSATVRLPRLVPANHPA